MSHAVLVLDDEKQICETLSDHLSDMGHLVSCYASGIAALDALRSQSFSDAIVEIRLQDICGFAFIERATLSRSEMRCIIHTDSLEYAGERLQSCAEGRIETVLIKPVYRLQTFSDILVRVGA